MIVNKCCYGFGVEVFVVEGGNDVFCVFEQGGGFWWMVGGDVQENSCQYSWVVSIVFGDVYLFLGDEFVVGYNVFFLCVVNEECFL